MDGAHKALFAVCGVALLALGNHLALEYAFALRTALRLGDCVKSLLVVVRTAFVETLYLKLKVVAVLELFLVFCEDEILRVVFRDKFLHLNKAFVLFENVP